MAIGKELFLVGFLITIIILLGIFFSNNLLNGKREDVVMTRMNTVVKEYEDMQSMLWMSEFLGEEATCVALEKMLNNMNRNIWSLGTRIDTYRMVTEEFSTDAFYLEQKREFNRKEVLYFIMLKRMKEMCKINQTIVSYFYQKKDLCSDCDAQSFILTDIKKDFEKIKKDDEIGVFSFDVDTNLTTISVLLQFYNVSSYPCTVIENNTYCGLRSKDELVGHLCSISSLSICS